MAENKLPPPTVADLRGHGVKSLTVWCLECRRNRELTFEQAKAPDDMLFPQIAKTRTFRCECGSTRVDVVPEWPPTGPGGLPLKKP
jgi:hypothetical protein